MTINKELIKEVVLEMFKDGDLKLGIHIEKLYDESKVEIEVMMLDKDGIELDETMSKHHFYLD